MFIAGGFWALSVAVDEISEWFVDAVKEDIRLVGVKKRMLRIRVRWRPSICCWDPWREEPKVRSRRRERWERTVSVLLWTVYDPLRCFLPRCIWRTTQRMEVRRLWMVELQENTRYFWGALLLWDSSESYLPNCHCGVHARGQILPHVVFQRRKARSSAKVHHYIDFFPLKVNSKYIDGGFFVGFFCCVSSLLCSSWQCFFLFFKLLFFSLLHEGQ